MSKLVVAYSILSYYRDANKDPHQMTKTFHRTFYSPNYNASDSTLVQYAKEHYNTGWVMEEIIYPSSTIKLN